jgi:hypothetical protein
MPTLPVVWVAQESSRLDASRPSYAAVAAALAAVDGPYLARYARNFDQLRSIFQGLPPLFAGGTDADFGAWVGAPRVTRTDPLLGILTTSVAAVYEFPETPFVAARFEAITGLQAAALTDALRALSRDFSTAVGAPFRPAVNGELAWWRSGAAAQTRTRDDAPGVLDTTGADNPLGPTTAATRPQTALEAVQTLNPFPAIQRAAQGAGNALATALWVGAAGTAAYLVYRIARPRRSPRSTTVAVTTQRR